MLDPGVRDFLALLAARNLPPIGTIPLAQARAQFEETFTSLAGTPVEVGSVEEFEAPGPHGPIPIRVYRPAGTTVPPPLIVFTHGGGFVCGSRNSYDAVCRLLCRESGCVVASIDYRLAPEFPAPGPFEDAFAAFLWLAAHGAEIGADTTRLAVAGDSAGGALAANIALRARDSGGPPIAHQLLIYPAVDEHSDTLSMRAYGEGHLLTNERMTFYWNCYVPRPEIAALPYVLAARAATLRDLPPATIVLAQCDPLFDMGAAYAQRLRDDGVAAELRVYDGMIHAFFSFIGIFPRGREAVVEAGRSVGDALAAPVRLSPAKQEVRP